MAVTPCQPSAEVTLSKITSHLICPPGSQHDVGATRIGRRKAPEQFPFRSSYNAAPVDDDSVWGVVLQRHPASSSEAALYEAAWASATSTSATSTSATSTSATSTTA